MKILYIHQYFKTPSEPGGTRSYWIARELIKNGHEVTMITTSSHIKSKEENMFIDGINVIYLRVPYNQKMGILDRLKSFTSFMFRSSAYVLKNKTFDFIIATSTPLTVGLPALVAKKLKKIPYVFEVRDLWPEVPIQMGGLKNKFIQKLAFWFEKKIYTNAEHIVALSPGMADGVRKQGIRDSKISMIPNMAKIEEFWPRPIKTELIKELGLRDDSFKLIHFGALGLANGAEYIVDAANMLKDRTDVDFIFLGGGSTEDVLKIKVDQLALSNVYFLGRFPMKETSEIVNFCDVSVVTFMDLPILYTNSPNKFFDSLSAGKPLIVNSAGWTKDLVESTGCGVFVDPKKPSELAAQIVELKSNPEALTEMGKRSRLLAENQYDKAILCKEFAEIINRIAKNKETDTYRSSSYKHIKQAQTK